MTRTHAEFLAEQPLESIKLAFRKGRPLINSIRRLKRQAVLEAEATVVPPSKPTVTLNDMHGYGLAKDWGLRLAEDISAWQQGVIAWEDVDRGALIYGPPGCGKTTYAQALADTCGVELVIASAGRWQARGHLGDFLKAMRASFAEATKKAPSILFIDEFDSMGSREIASDGDNHDYKRQAINGLLECLDPVEGREGVVVIGATNDPKAIDPALLRPGRLEITIQIPLPDDIARVGILKQHLAGHEIAGDLAEFVASSRGWSGADIMKVARDVRRLARVRGVPLTERPVDGSHACQTCAECSGIASHGRP
jgi:cell division protease FtsH